MGIHTTWRLFLKLNRRRLPLKSIIVYFFPAPARPSQGVYKIQPKTVTAVKVAVAVLGVIVLVATKLVTARTQKSCFVKLEKLRRN